MISNEKELIAHLDELKISLNEIKKLWIQQSAR